MKHGWLFLPIVPTNPNKKPTPNNLSNKQPTQALLHGYHLHKLLSELNPAIRIDVLTVGAPMFADQTFMDATAKRLNQRNIVYVGDGAGGSFDQYRVGDPIVQVGVVS